MNLQSLLESIHESPSLSTPEEIIKAVNLIIDVQAMRQGERDTLKAAWLSGPLFDGDVPSKPGRDSLISSGFMAKVVIKGQDGFNACTYKGNLAYRLIKAGA